jgi:hypothetical protein
MYNYVYKTIDAKTGEFYIGSRQSKVSFEYDVDYFGNGKWIKEMSKQLSQSRK